MKYEINIDETYGDGESRDEWGAAFCWLDENRGVEYNFCIDGENNCSAIYKMEIDEKTGYMETDCSIFSHYEIDFEDRDWAFKLNKEMEKVARIFHHDD